jgi:succinoglycan biosynthesis transport protein ExoP
MSEQLPAKRPEDSPEATVGSTSRDLALHSVSPAPVPMAEGGAGALAAYGGADDGGGASTVNIQRYLDAAKRYKWMIMGLCAFGVFGGVIASRFRAPVYSAQSTIFVETGAMQGQRQGPIQESQLLQNTNWVDLLRSFTVLDSVVVEQRLFLEPADQADTVVFRNFQTNERFIAGDYELKVDPTGRRWALSAAGQQLEQNSVDSAIGTSVGFNWVAPPGSLRPKRTIAFHVSTPRQAALDIGDRLDAKIPVLNGNFLRLTLTGASPVITAATLNSLSDRFVQVAADLKKAKLDQLAQILSEQLKTAHEQLVSAEAAYETFKVNTITEPGEQIPTLPGVPTPGGSSAQSPAMGSYFQSRFEVEQLRRDRTQIEALLAQPPDSGVSTTNLETIPSVVGSSDLRAALNELMTQQAYLRVLQARYTNDNPLVVRQLADVRRRQTQDIPNMLRGLVAELRTREAGLNQRVDVQSRDMRQIPQRAIEDARLRREVDIAGQLYTELQQRASEARVAAASSVPDVRILDPAVVPDRPTKNLVPAIIAAGAGAGLALAIALVLILDRLDRRLRYPEQVTRGLGLEILGAVPRVRNTAGGLAGEDAQQVVEALRTVRLNLSTAYGSAGPLITTITSPGSGDGKSFLSSNLAVAFADGGHRTLLIDGDIRRGTLHRVLGANRKPGLLDHLSGQATREAIIQRTKVASVDFIGCGTRQIGGPELLASPAMSQLLIAMRSQYSVIIIDSAPLGAGVDALVLGSLAGSMVLVMRTGVTDRELALAKLGDLDRLPIRVLGAVLNDVKAQGVYKYYSYLPGYTADDEPSGDREAGAAPDRTLPRVGSTGD